MYNAIEREFNTEVKQRKSIARGAYHKKGGSKSKKCSLPSDNLTAAQKRKLNGPVETYAINRPMSYEAFKAMPRDLQQAHLDYIQNRFATGITSVGKYVFGLAPETLRLHATTHGLTYAKYDKGHRGDTEGLRLWAKGLYATSEDTSTEDAEINEETVISDGFVATAPKEEKADRAGLGDLPELFYGGKLCMSGTAKEILPRLLTLIGNNDAWLSVHLCFTGKDD